MWLKATSINYKFNEQILSMMGNRNPESNVTLLFKINFSNALNFI